MKEAQARFSKVARRVWHDARFRQLSSPPPNGQTLWLRLLTGPELTNIPGLFPVRESGLAESLGWPVEAFREAFREVSGEGWAKADWKAGLVWLPNAPKYNRPESPNVVRGWRQTWIELPECALKDEAFRALRAFTEGLGEAFAKAFGEACPQPLANQEQEQEQEQEQDPQTRAGAREGEPRTTPVGIYDFAGDAWCEGILAALGGQRPPRPKPSEIGELDKVVRAQAPPTDSAEKVVAWLRVDVERFARSVDMAFGGATVRRYVAWVSGGRPDRPSGKIAKPPGFLEHEETRRREREVPDVKIARLAAQAKKAGGS